VSLLSKNIKLSLGWLALALVFFTRLAQSAETIPPKPEKYFNDYTHSVSPASAERLNQRLTQFERDTSNQILVTIYPKMQSDSDLADYTQRIAQSWQVGQKDKNNGAVLFVFKDDRKMFLQVGYGLEGVLPDALAKRIIEDEIKPHFKNGNLDGGVSAGVEAILQATRGEYKGVGRTINDSRGRNSGKRTSPAFIIFAIIFIIVFGRLMPRRRSRYYGSSGYGWSSGGWGGGSSGGSSGGFSSGGGSFGGGGAGGSW
jgi:uncharacterized protein